MSGNFHPSLFWQFSVSFPSLLSNPDGGGSSFQLIIEFLSFLSMLSQVSWYVRKSVFAIFILFAYVYLSYFLALWIHLCVIRAHFWLRKKVVFLFHHPKNLIKWQCILIVVNCELLSVLESVFTIGKAEAKWILRLPCLSAFCVALENCYKHELAALVSLLRCSVDDSKIGFRMILAILKFLEEQWSMAAAVSASFCCTNGLNWLHWMFKRYYL